MSNTSNLCRVGIIDNDSTSAKRISQDVEKSGYKVHSILDTTEKALEQYASLPDLYLINLDMDNATNEVNLAIVLSKCKSVPVGLIAEKTISDLLKKRVVETWLGLLYRPVNTEELRTFIEELAVHKMEGAMANYSSTPTPWLSDCIFIKEGGQHIRVNFSDIFYLMSSHIYVNVITTQREYIVRTSLTDYLTRFPPDHFVRVHRSYVVNLQFLEKISHNSVWVGGKEIPLAQQYRELLMVRVLR